MLVMLTVIHYLGLLKELDNEELRRQKGLLIRGLRSPNFTKIEFDTLLAYCLVLKKSLYENHAIQNLKHEESCLIPSPILNALKLFSFRPWNYKLPNGESIPKRDVLELEGLINDWTILVSKVIGVVSGHPTDPKGGKDEKKEEGGDDKKEGEEKKEEENKDGDKKEEGEEKKEGEKEETKKDEEKKEDDKDKEKDKEKDKKEEEKKEDEKKDGDKKEGEEKKEEEKKEEEKKEEEKKDGEKKESKKETPKKDESKKEGNAATPTVSKGKLSLTELHFPDSGATHKFNVKNDGTTRLAVKVKCSDNKLYRVNPVFSIAEVGQDVIIEVIRSTGPSKEDKLVVVTREAPTDAKDAANLFKGDATNLFKGGDPTKEHAQTVALLADAIRL
uniref:Major sperm protein n=1 Tax=Panagrolaimus sp. JU765 TaxID=591449 RepID=A0AC34QSQ3_9BILA